MAADGEGSGGGLRRLPPAGLSEPPPDNLAAHRAAFRFDFTCPHWSARRPLSPAQKRWARRALVLAGPAGLFWPEGVVALAGLAGLAVFAVILLYRVMLFVIGSGPSVPGDEPAGRWPVYTLLIALKDEAGTAAQLAAAVRRLDYPEGRIDLKLLIETGDAATREALLAEVWPAGTELLTVPPGLPRTKPRALNYGLTRARGEFVVVYDAEDRPHPDQLKAAVRAFRRGGPSLACVQAPLVGAGASGWIGAQWALEYAIQFGRLLPAQAHLGLPVMLGGTSNHFRRRSLEQAGGWDAWNVTEDAELGLRLARLGHHVGMIEPPTLETPPERLMVWINQRSRWLKGFLQTWLVMMRQPGRAVGELGLAGFLSVQLTLGASILSALVHGLWAVWFGLCLILPELSMAPAFLAIACVSYCAGFVMALLAPGRKDAGRLLLALSLPLYWPLQTAAMGRALYGLVRCPHFWAKTPHTAPGSPRAVIAKPKRS